MTKDELLQLAAAGVVQELHRMQDRINALAREFPDLVCNQDGTIPAVLPVRLKNGHDAPAPKARAPKLSKAERIEQIRAYLQAHPGASTPQIGDAIGIAVSSGLRNALRLMAKPVNKPKTPRDAILWKLK